MSLCLTKADQLREAENGLHKLESDHAALIKSGKRVQDNLRKEINSLKSKTGKVENDLYQTAEDLSRQQNFAESLRKNVSALTHQLNDEKRKRMHAEGDACYWKDKADRHYYYQR